MWERLVTAPAAVRFHLYRLLTRFVYRRAFGSIGAGTTIVAPLRLRNCRKIFVGRETVIFEGAWLQCEEQPSAQLEIGDHVYVGHHVHLHATGVVKIGDRTVLADRVTVLDGIHAPAAFDEVSSTGNIRIGRNVFIGVGATILGGVTVGDDAQVGAGAVVTRDVESGSVVAGVPARPIGQSRLDT